MDSLGERVEVLGLAGARIGVDHDLAVEHVAAGGEVQLREIALEWLGPARLQQQLFAIDERERAEAVVLGLVGPLLADRQLRFAAGQLRFDRRLQGQHRR